MKIALIGNCQVEVIAQAMAKMRPEARFETVHLGLTKLERLSEFISNLDMFDEVFAHFILDSTSPVYGPNLRRARATVKFIPILHFSGLHPDYLVVPRLPSPLGAGQATPDWRSPLGSSTCRGVGLQLCSTRSFTPG